MSKEYIADKATLDNVNNIVSALTNRWPDARAVKVDKLDLIQTTLNTPDGNTLAAWIQSISNSATNAYNKANEANNNAANAANLASQANNNAWNAYQEAINAKNVVSGNLKVIEAPAKKLSVKSIANTTFTIYGRGKFIITSRDYVHGDKINIDGIDLIDTLSSPLIPMGIEIYFNQSVTIQSVAGGGGEGVISISYLLFD